MAIALGRALAFDPGTGKPMKNRVLLPMEMQPSWIALAEEAAASFVRGEAHRRRGKQAREGRQT